MSDWFEKNFAEVWGTVKRTNKPKLLARPRDEEGVRLVLNMYVRASHIYSRLTVYSHGRKREIERIDLPYQP